MIPGAMEAYLRERLPDRTWKRRLQQRDGMAWMEFGPLDIERLGLLGITVDALGPFLVACLWDDESPLEIGGYLVVDNLAMGRPSMGGIRMLPEITPLAVHNLARGMTLKNAAAQLPFGGGKSGIVAPAKVGADDRPAIISGFARLLGHYHELYLPGPDVGTNDQDMRTVAIENGLDRALSKPADMGGSRIDEIGAAGGGCVIALQALLDELPRLRAHPSFGSLTVPEAEGLTVLVQGFGAVGAHAARILGERLPGALLVGASDAQGYLYDPAGLPIADLFGRWQRDGLVSMSYGRALLDGETAAQARTKFSNSRDDLLRESAFCLIPATPVANYLDVDPDSHPSMTVERMGRWSVIIEGANTYSPDPARRQARARMERAVFRERGVLIATDYLVNSGGVIFAAQERLIPTPDALQIPPAAMRDSGAVQAWLEKNAEAFGRLSEERRGAGEAYRDRVIRRNMRELVDRLLEDPDALPCEAAESISIRRIAAGESERTAADIMEEITLAPATTPLQKAAEILVECGCPLIAVVDDTNKLAGVITEWDFVRAMAAPTPPDTPIGEVMTRQVVTAAPADTLLEVVRRLEIHEFSALPVVDSGKVVGIVSSHLLATRSLTRLLQSQEAGG